MSFHAARRGWAAPRLLTLLSAIAIVANGCGRSETPTVPTPTPIAPSPTPPTPQPPATRWAFSGRVVDVTSGAPIVGAVLEPTGFPSVTTDGAGQYFFQADTWPQYSPFLVTVQAGGFITREAQVLWQNGARTGVEISLIRDASPFSLDFYRQLVRNAAEAPGALQSLRRWSAPPRFYIRTVDEDFGRAVEPEVLALVQEYLVKGVAMWTGWSIPPIEASPAARAAEAGVIRVVFERRRGNYCGRATVGRNPGEITFALDSCDCGSRKVPPDTVVHEVGHALGFWHVRDRESVMYPVDPGGCRPAEVSSLEKYHAAIAYRRLAGSTDIDRDYNQTGLQTPEALGPESIDD